LEENKLYLKVGNGVFRASIITIVLLVIFAIIMSAAEISNPVVSVYILVVTSLSIVYGSIYAAKKNNRNGWLVGILVAACYMAVLYLISGIFFGDFSLDYKDSFRLILALLVGALSGMLGINI
jgi:putative membrane protein (TIGR04086 family)